VSVPCEELSALTSKRVGVHLPAQNQKVIHNQSYANDL